MELGSRYEPEAVERKWYQIWRDAGYFKPHGKPGAPTFSIAMPPPNVTGVLHVGHALNTTWQDILVRYHRMLGDDTVWIPGTDHAGIHTQMKVDEMIRQEGLDRRTMGRDAFIERVWQWKDQYGGEILNQVERLGASVDWSRLRFTLDSGLSSAVTEVFVRLYEEGLLYRGHYITNWCVSCRTALSDIEVEHEDKPGQLTYITYPLEGQGGSITVATTRPETMLGDTAVAVHPEDPRWQRYIGQRVRLPLMDRLIPVIADEYVDPSYGTGAVKVTPAHDPNDFAIGERHQLEKIKVIGDDGLMTDLAGAYQGLDRMVARARVLTALRQLELVSKVEEITHSVGHCEKCGSIIEPLLSLQWFVRVAPLAKPAIEAVTAGDIAFVPDRFEKIYMNWMTNIRDWCVSRQIWWGHRIPAYYCEQCGEVVVARTAPDTCAHCGGHFYQDEDVLDTWFSSALWPFSTLGWPATADDFHAFYPTSVLSTGYDIIFFWVARMIMQGIHFTDQVPFKTVLMHGLVRDELGRKMSKSLGNGVNPMQVVDQYGADALRISLILSSAPGNDLRYSQERVEAGSHFANKIYNATRFVLMNLGNLQIDVGHGALELDHAADRWIVHRLNLTAHAMTEHLNRFEFGQAARAIYDFLWDDYCDWYIELAKVRLRAADESSRLVVLQTLVRVASDALKLLHPFMPFVTEELWQALPHQGPSIMVADWPQPENAALSARDAKHFDMFQGLVRTVRNLRAELNLPPTERIALEVWVQTEDVLDRWTRLEPELSDLTRASSVRLRLGQEGLQKPLRALSGVTDGAVIYIPLEGLLDLNRERARIEKALGTAESDRERSERQLADPNFVSRAPEAIVAKTRATANDLAARIARLRERLEDLR